MHVECSADQTDQFGGSNGSITTTTANVFPDRLTVRGISERETITPTTSPRRGKRLYEGLYEELNEGLAGGMFNTRFRGWRDFYQIVLQAARRGCVRERASVWCTGEIKKGVSTVSNCA